MNQDNLAFTPALKQAQLIRSGEISPLELVELYLNRIELLDHQLGSYYSVAADLAWEDAQAKTKQLAQTKDKSQLPPFFGVPTTIKDLNSVAGLPCTYGVALLKDKIGTYDDGVVGKMKSAGFIILGKTATSELGSLPYTEQPGFPPTCNPWHLDYTAGGSSGGAAAAVASGLCSVAHGSDGGGSIRGPAFCCGIVGIKPTRGRVSNAPVGDFQSGISSNGPLARTVSDAAALLDVMSGYITGDPYWLSSPDISFLSATKQQPSPLHIGFATAIAPVGEAAPICRQSVLDTAKLLEGMGHTLEPVSLDYSDLIEPFKVIWQAGVTSSGIPLEALSPMNRWIAEQSGSAGDYLQSVHKMQLISRQIVAFFHEFDVLLLPTYMHPPIKVGEWQDLTPEATLDRIINWILPCPPFNAAGNPAIALPTGFTPEGLPIGIQLVARPAAETTLLSLAAQLEAINPWQQYIPPTIDLLQK